MGMEFRSYYLAREWQKKGHKVRIVAADFSHLRKQNPEVRKDFELQNIDGVEYQWIRTGRYEGNGLARAKTMFEFCGKLSLNAGNIVRSFRPDVVISSSTYPLDTYPAQRIAKIAGCRYIHEAHDLWPLTLTEIGGMDPRNPFVVLLGAAEREAYSGADKVVSLFPDAYKHMLEHGLQSREKFVYLPNGIVTGDWEDAEKAPEEHTKLIGDLKKQGRFVVMYLGGHAISNALDVLLDGAALTEKDNNAAYVLVGKGVEKDRLMERAAKENLSNVFFLPPVSKRQVPSVLREADALYVGAARSSLYRFGVSLNKVYDYMMAGRPIIYGVEASNNDVADAGCGITIKPDDPAALAEAVKELLRMDPEDRDAMGARGHESVINNYDYSIIAEKFLNIMTD